MATKTCFLICPIGEEGSEIRKSSDDLMDLIIIPALEKFDFDVVRADRIPRPSVITTDIIQLVQNAELCIIDLTGSNPNVFYECGRRHETGKPFIQLIRKGEKMPFDVSGIRTIIYDFSTVRTAHEAIKEIQNYVAELSTSDFSPRTAGESLSSLASAIRRIERKLDGISAGESGTHKDRDQKEFLDRIRIEANPKRAFNQALDAEELDKARNILPILHDKLGNTNDVLLAAMIFANAGDTAAKEICVRILETPSEPLDIEVVRNAVIALSSYYDIVDGEKEGAKVLDPIIHIQVKRDDIDDATKAYLLNRLQMLLYASGHYERALTIIEQVIDLAPKEVYIYNKGLIHDKLGMKAKAAEEMERFLTAVGPEYAEFIDLARIAVIFEKAERKDDAKRILVKMNNIDPRRTAEFIESRAELRTLMLN